MSNIQQFIDSLKNELNPYKFYRQNLDLDFNSITAILGIGKCAVEEVFALKELCINANKILCVSKARPTYQSCPFEVLYADHPIGDTTSCNSGDAALNFINTLPENSNIIITISGGASALIWKPDNSISLADKKNIYKQLLTSSANINEMNILRKHISQLKNGGLVKNFKGIKITTLISSDVPNNDIFTVGSSPTLYSPNDVNEINLLANKYLNHKYVELIKNVRIKNNQPKNKFEHQAILCLTYQHLKEQCEFYFKNLGFKYLIEKFPRDEQLDNFFDIKVKHDFLTNKTENFAWISGGELTFNVFGNGKGGRNSHFVAVATKKIFFENIYQLNEDQLNSVKIFSWATDGTDGPTAFAGAFMDYQNAKKISLDYLKDAIERNNTYPLLEEYQCTITTGPTGINIMDLRGIIIDTNNVF